MRNLIIISFLFTMGTLYAQSPEPAQDSPAEETEEKRAKRDFQFGEKLEFFHVISSSKAKCDVLVFDEARIWNHKGYIINSITIEVLDPFGHVDVEALKRKRLFKMADALHVTTSDKIIRNQLLFKEGEYVDPELIILSQEILYENAYFRDAKIHLEPHPVHENTVDIHILVQDIWSWGFWGTVDHTKVGGSLIFNKFAGLPQQFRGGLNFNYDKENPLTASIDYKFRNIKKTFVNIDAHWMHDWRDYVYEVGFKRRFISTKPQWAGGFQMGWYRTQHDDMGENKSYYNKQDAWLARSFPLHVLDKSFMNFILAGRVVRKHYTATPNLTAERLEEGDPFQNHTSYMVGVGVASKRYVQEEDVFDFFQYRNMPVGFNMHLVGGVSMSERHYNRGYLGMSANHSIMTCAGYFQEELGVGTYIDRGLEQVTISLNSKYFTHKFPLKKWGLRQYIYQNFVYGISRPEGENILIDNGAIKGIRLKDVPGSSYFAINLETEIYSPVKVIGTQARIFAFADLGVQGNRSDVPLAGGRFYHAYGAGIRLNNWKLGINFIEIAFVYYPNTGGLNNNSVEVAPNFYNSKIFGRNSLYSWGAVGPVN